MITTLHTRARFMAHRLDFCIAARRDRIAVGRDGISASRDRVSTRRDGAPAFARRLLAAGALAALLLAGAGAAPRAARAQDAAKPAAEMSVAQIIALPHHEQKPHLDAHIAAQPSDPEGHFQLGNWYYDENRMADALASYQKVIALQADHFRAVVNAALALEAMGRRAESLALYERFIAAHPKDARAVAYYGEALWALDKKTEAVNQLRKALQLDPGCPEAHFHMGVVFAENGIYREAIREWRQVEKAGQPQDLVARARENIRKAEENL